MLWLRTLLAALVLPFLAAGAGARPWATFSEPPILRSEDGVAAVQLNARIDPRGLGPSFAYFIPKAPFWIGLAPTIEVSPGDHIQIQYHNVLPPIVSDEAHGLPDDTNLHFHGLTVSPKAPGDDVLTTLISPLERTAYDVRVAADQPPGVYWYHPHPHHETSWQVGNGMAGAIIVDGIENVVPSLGGLRERLIIVRQIFLHPNHEAVTLNARLCGLSHMTPKARIAFLRAHPAAARADDEKLNTVITLNGQAAGSVSIGIAPGERQLFRVINATPKRNLDLAVDGERLELLAEDGVPLGYLPGAERSRRVSDVVIPPGGRAEFVVIGPRQPTVLRSLAFDSGPKGDPDPAFEMASLIDDTGSFFSSDSRVPMPAAATAAVPDYYRTPPAAPVAQRTVRLQETADGTKFFINRRSFDPHDTPMFVARSGTVEEWTLENEAEEVHTFHTHQVHFLIESIGGQTIPPAQRHWLDTVNVPYKRNYTPGTVKILVDFRDPVVRGTFVFHCHILDHEDGGMMAKIRVV